MFQTPDFQAVNPNSTRNGNISAFGALQSPATKVSIPEIPATAIQRLTGLYRTTGSVAAIDVAAELQAGWPHPPALTPGIWPVWGVMS